MSSYAMGQAPPEWVPSPDSLKALGEEVEIGAYRIRPPAGYEPKPPMKKPGYQLFAWAGPKRPDGSVAGFIVTLTDIPIRERIAGPEFYLNLDMENVRKARSNVDESKPERGTINELTFARTRWSGRHKTTNVGMFGFSYVAVDGRTVITILSNDYDGHGQELLTAEAAAQTIRKP